MELPDVRREDDWTELPRRDEQRMFVQGVARAGGELQDDGGHDALAQRIGLAAPVWCIFDNTALGAATTNALELMARLEEADQRAIGLP